jgi:hypothetical protein
MVFDHHRSEVFYLLTAAFVLRQMACLYFGDAALGRVLVKGRIGVRRERSDG